MKEIKGDKTGMKTIKVLVTGFGPFPNQGGGTYEQNASHEITRLLPLSLPPNSSFNPTTTNIQILNPTAADNAYVKVEYAHIRAYVSALHTAYAADVDLILHIGMADGWDYVSIERRAYKQTFTSSWGGPSTLNHYYVIKDAAGRTVRDTGECPWGDDVPMGLTTKLDIDGLVEGASRSLGKNPLRQVKAHEDPGTYCCGFIYYESLANKFTKNTPADVLFCHVPSNLDRQSLSAGRDAILAVIGAAVNQITKIHSAAEASSMTPANNASWTRESGLGSSVAAASTTMTSNHDGEVPVPVELGHTRLRAEAPEYVALGSTD